MFGRTTTLVVLGAVALAGLSGCTDREAGSPTTEPATSTTTDAPSEPSNSGNSGELPTDGAPKVENPLPVDKFVGAPCSGMTSAQASSFGVAFPGRAGNEVTGNYCVWDNNEFGAINLSFISGRGGLSELYSAEKKGKFAYFAEMPAVDGFPSVVALQTDRRDKGECLLSVGVDDDVVMSVALTQSKSKVGSGDPCQVSLGVAEEIVKTVRAGG